MRARACTRIARAGFGLQRRVPNRCLPFRQHLVNIGPGRAAPAGPEPLETGLQGVEDSALNPVTSENPSEVELPALPSWQSGRTSATPTTSRAIGADSTDEGQRAVLGLSLHEGQRGRVAPSGKDRAAVSGAPLFGGFPERGEEAGVGGVELFSHAEGDRMEERRDELLEKGIEVVSQP